MVFVALKPCRFGGTDYLIGDSIPADKVLPERVEALRAMGLISIGFEEVVNQLDESLRGAIGDQHTDDEDKDENTESTEDKDENTESTEDKDEEQLKRRGRRRAE
jgi:hypothetical protein|nr:MAG TPA: hypothetical protein [Bacteriophage sp.]